MKQRIFFLVLYITNSLVHATVIHVTSEEQYNQLINSDTPVVIQFAAQWCNICQGVKRPFEQIAVEPNFQSITFASVDIDEMQDMVKKIGIVGVPSFLLMQRGNKKHQEIGVPNITTFKESFRATLHTTFNNTHEQQSEQVPEPIQTVPQEVQTPDLTLKECEQDTIPYNQKQKKHKKIIKVIATTDENNIETYDTSSVSWTERIYNMLLYCWHSFMSIITAGIEWVKKLFDNS